MGKEEEEEIKREYKSRQRMIFFPLFRLRRLSLNCWGHKRLPVSDPLSIQDQGVSGSNYCKFLCMLSTGREGGRERQRREQWHQPSSQLQLACVQRSPLNLWKRFHPQLPLSSAGLIWLTSHPSLGCQPLTRLTLLSDLTGPEALRVVMAGSEERSLSLGLWVLLLLSAGMEEVVEGCSCLPAHPQQLFCSSEIGKSSLYPYNLNLSQLQVVLVYFLPFCLVVGLFRLDFPHSSIFSFTKCTSQNQHSALTLSTWL